MSIKVLKADVEDIILDRSVNTFSCEQCDNCHMGNEHECASPYVHVLVEIGDDETSIWLEERKEWLLCPMHECSPHHRWLQKVAEKFGFHVEVER